MKHWVPWFVVVVVLVAMFNVCFFTLLSGIAVVTPSVWVSYGFIHFALLLLFCTPAFEGRRHSAVADTRRTLYLGTGLFFAVTLVVNVCLILVSLNSDMVQLFQKFETSPEEGFLPWPGTPVSMAKTWLINTPLVAALLIYLVANIAVNADTAEQQERHERELVYVKDASQRLRGIAAVCADRDMQRRVSQMADLVASSPLHSSVAAAPIEEKLMARLPDLEQACMEADKTSVQTLCAEIDGLVRLRNAAVQAR